MQNEAVDFQLVPPHLHPINATEQEIKTFKTILLRASEVLINIPHVYMGLDTPPSYHHSKSSPLVPSQTSILGRSPTQCPF